MGFDVSFHPVDVRLIQDRIFPYVRGEGDLSDLVANAVRIARVRFRANAWGLGVLDLQHAQADAKRSKKKGNKGMKDPGAQPELAAPPVPDPFHSDLYVWGRPFFITVPSDQVSAAIDRYLAARPEDVDGIAEEMIRLIDPALVGHVKPNEGGTLPDDASLARGIIREIDFLREAFPKLRTGGTVKAPDGETYDARELFAGSLPLAVLTFAAAVQPGWMARGYVWPTSYISEAGLDDGGLFETPESLFAPFFGPLGIEAEFEDTITQNYMVGGYVRPENVSLARRWLEDHAEELVQESDGDSPETDVDFQKILEAVRDAELRKMGFAEATEIYSGIMGIMN